MSRHEEHRILTPGTEVAQYRVVDKLGSGRMGEAYSARDMALGEREVMLRFLDHEFAGDEVVRARFMREIQAAAALNHPNIFHIFDISEFEKRLFFVTEPLQGRPLHDLIRANELTLSTSLDIAIAMCEGLNAAHSTGVVHRGLNPCTVIVAEAGWVRLSDFGLARVISEGKLTRSGSTMGTVDYMAPEQIQHKHVDDRCDIFSCGVILYEMLTGRHPFRKSCESETLEAILHSTPAAPARVNGDINDGVENIILKALQKSAESRYQHVDDMLADLKRERARSTVAESEARYRSLNDDVLDSSEVGTCIIDASMRVVWVNRALERFTGVPRDSIIGTDIREVARKRIHPLLEDGDEAVERLLSTYEDNSFMERFACHIRAEGRRLERWLEHWSQPIRFGLYAGGRIEHYTDITERKRFEAELKQSQLTLRQVIDIVPHMIFAKDREGRFHLANAAHARVYGVPISEVEGRLHSDIHPVSEETEAMLQADRDVIDSGKALYIPEEPFTGINGEVRYLQTIKIPFSEYGSNEPVMLGVAVDITERKRAEDAHAESRRAMSTLLSNLPGMAYRCKNDPHWTMEFISDGCLPLTGYTPGELIDNESVSYAEIIHENYRDRVWNDVQKCLENQEPFQLVYVIITKSGVKKWIWEQGRGVFDREGNLLAIEGLMTDISALKESENKLKQISSELRVDRKELEEKNIALKQILTTLEVEKQEYRQTAWREIKNAVEPLLEKLKGEVGRNVAAEIQAVETAIGEALTDDVDDFRKRYSLLSSRELQVAEFIKQGKTSRQISQELALSLATIHKHREQIRKKLGISNENIDLGMYLELH